tara:strand:+ start:953 stop:1261 length:309 start_codon:yes stop_codon:yes gene_type:complete
MTDKDYSLSSIKEDLIAELEDNKEEILESKGDYLHEYVDGSISVYTYDQIMIYANNSELWHESSVLGGETVQEQIIDVIYEHLSGVAWEWYNEKEELQKEEA